MIFFRPNNIIGYEDDCFLPPYKGDKNCYLLTHYCSTRAFQIVIFNLLYKAGLLRGGLKKGICCELICGPITCICRKGLEDEDNIGK